MAKNNMKVTDLNVKLQVITTVSAALNLYWDLVSFNEDLRIKQQAVSRRSSYWTTIRTAPSLELSLRLK